MMTTTHDIEKIVCPCCVAVVDVQDNFCRYCGAALNETPSPGGEADGISPAVAPPNGLAVSPSTAAGLPIQGTGLSSWIQSRTAVFVALFVVLGPLAIPMLWRSDRFSRAAKIVLTALVLVLTVVVVWLIGYVLSVYILEPIRQLHEQMQEMR